MRQSRAAEHESGSFHDYGLGDGHISKLIPYPKLEKGNRTPFDLWRYGGRGESSSDRTILPMSFDEWLRFNLDHKPELLGELREYMASRYEFDGEAIPHVLMPGGWKPVMRGPVARLPGGISSWQEFNTLSEREIRERSLSLQTARPSSRDHGSYGVPGRMARCAP